MYFYRERKEKLIRFARARKMILCFNNIPLSYVAEDDSEVFRERDQEVISPVSVANDNMDSRIGLDYIVENSDYVSKLAAALDTNNEIVKKQVFELLSALCAYSRSGYCRAIETLENYKVNRRNRRAFIPKIQMDMSVALIVCALFTFPFTFSFTESQRWKISLQSGRHGAWQDNRHRIQNGALGVHQLRHNFGEKSAGSTTCQEWTYRWV